MSRNHFSTPRLRAPGEPLAKSVSCWTPEQVSGSQTMESVSLLKAAKQRWKKRVGDSEAFGKRPVHGHLAENHRAFANGHDEAAVAQPHIAHLHKQAAAQHRAASEAYLNKDFGRASKLASHAIQFSGAITAKHGFHDMPSGWGEGSKL